MLLIIVMFIATAEGGVVPRTSAGCPSGTYEIEDMMCEGCKQGMFSTEIGAKTPLACKNCPKGTYSMEPTSCTPCPINTVSPPGAYDPLECTAPAGYFSTPGGIGVECPLNHYCAQGTTTPTPCPTGTISPLAATRCVPGIQTVEFLDWVFGIAWIILFSTGVAGLGIFKKILLVQNKQTRVPETQTIQIQITR